MTTRIRRNCFDYWKTKDLKLVCYRCSSIMDPARQQWEAEHELVRAHGGSDDPPNVKPVCIPCHKAKTKTDKGRIAKGVRQRDRHFNIKRSKKPMPGGKNSEWKQTFYHGWVRRDD